MQQKKKLIVKHFHGLLYLMCKTNLPTGLLFAQVQALSSFAEVLTTAFAWQVTVALSAALVSSSEPEVVELGVLGKLLQSMHRKKTFQINH